MKALSIIQPWAWAILHAGKDVENRNWYCSYRGPLLIHAGQKFDEEGRQWIISEFGIAVPSKSDCPRGAIVGRVDMLNCLDRGAYESRWVAGKFGFILANPTPMAPVPYKGRLGIFECPIVVSA